MEEQMRQFIAANRKPADAATWDQMCGSLMFRFNSWRGWTSRPVRDISSAFRVSQGSTIISTDFMRAPVGAFHFFDIGGPGNGHVMQDARGGGLVCLSTGYALSESLGSAIGFQSVPGYVAAKGARYLGWSKDYAGGTINVSGLAGLGAELIEEEEDLGDTMKYINVVGGGRGTVGELTFTPYTADTHGAWADTYAAVASTHFDGEDVDEITFNVLRQDALNRQAQLVAVVRAATGGNVGDIADTIKAELRAAVTEALDGFTVDADISDEAASNIGQIAADRVIERIVSGLAS